MKTLIIDRVKLFQEIIAGVLSDTSIDHSFATTGAEAMKMLERDYFQCICVSLYLDDIDGIALCRNIRKIEKFKHTPIVLLTSESNQAVFTKAISSGITDVFVKDRIHELVNFIERFTQINMPLEGKVLYIEDQKSQRDLVTEMFKVRKLQVDAFDNAEDAWEAFLNDHYHLVITDLVLDGNTSGILLINKIRRLDGSKGDTPILTITGFDDTSRRISLYHMGVTDYVTKPIIEEELIARVRNLITNQKALEREIEIREVMNSDKTMRRSQKMEVLGKMTGGIAHDYNNVLGVISGFSELLQMDLEAQPQLQEYARQIYLASRTASALTAKLLAFTRRNTDEIELLNLTQIIKDMLPMLTKTVTSGVEVTVNVDDGVWSVCGDLHDFENALLNMSINAKHAMETSGTLTIATNNLDLDLAQSEKFGLPAGQYVRLTVRDTGTGMDEDVRSHIFDPFFSTKGDKGTGLGLSQVYGFVQRSNGAISVKSKIGKGTAFDLYFPRCDELPAAKSVTDIKEEDIHDGKGKRILVVDDDTALRMLTREILVQSGYHVEAVANAHEAMQELAKQHYDVMITDIIMPGENGYDLADKVRSQYPAVQVILATGYDRDIKNVEERRKSYKYRLQKPVNRAKLLMTIQSVLG